MKEVQVVAFCDGVHDHREPATTERREVLAGEPYVLDLCDPCAKEFGDAVDVVRAWLERGSPVAKATRVPKQSRKGVGGRPKVEDLSSACNQCDYVGPTRSALGQHMKSKHGMTLTEAGV